MHIPLPFLANEGSGSLVPDTPLEKGLPSSSETMCVDNKTSFFSEEM